MGLRVYRLASRETVHALAALARCFWVHFAHRPLLQLACASVCVCVLDVMFFRCELVLVPSCLFLFRFGQQCPSNSLIIDSFSSCSARPCVCDAVAALNMAPPTTKAPESATRRAKAPLLKLHWNPVPQERLERCVFDWLAFDLHACYSVRVLF